MNLIGPVKCRGRLGYLTTYGNFAIEPVFEDLGPCSEGAIAFRQSDRIGFLDFDGSVKIPAVFENHDGLLPTFQNGLAAVGRGGKFGYIDKDGNWQIPPIHAAAWNFLGDMALVETGKGYIIIDTSGKHITKLDVWDIPRMQDWIKDWDCFRCLFSSKQGVSGFVEGCVNWRGQTVFSPVHDAITDFFEGVAGFLDGEETLDARWGLVSFGGDILKEPQFLEMTNFSEGLASAAQSLSSTGWIDEYGYIDVNGDWVIPPRFLNAYAFSNGLARVAVGGHRNKFGEDVSQRRYGFINGKGEMVIDARYSTAMDFVGNYAIAEYEGKTTVLDRLGNIVWKENA